MKYSIRLNAVNNPEKNVKAFATVTFGDCFVVTNIAVVKGREGEPFVSMPSFRSKERTEHNEPVYKDVCNPITREFREQLYGDILGLYKEMEQTGRTELVLETEGEPEPAFTVAVSPFEREGSNMRGTARIYFENCFVVGNVSILQGKEREFVAMPSYQLRGSRLDGKSQYQDVCFPITKEFRERLNSEIMACYQQEKEKALTQGRGQMEDRMQAAGRNQPMGRAQTDRDLPFR